MYYIWLPRNCFLPTSHNMEHVYGIPNVQVAIEMISYTRNAHAHVERGTQI